MNGCCGTALKTRAAARNGARKLTSAESSVDRQLAPLPSIFSCIFFSTLDSSVMVFSSGVATLYIFKIAPLPWYRAP